MGAHPISPRVAALALLAVAVAMSAGALAQQGKFTDVGRYEYEGACAVCHGSAGRGDGPLAGQMKSRMPDLTGLARNNHGIFPFDQVYQTIDGQREVQAHGTREMPVWGRAFRLQSSVFFDRYPQVDPDSAARSRILALTEYLYRIQQR
jgi:mono/diheme cytochrome c family protein